MLNRHAVGRRANTQAGVYRCPNQSYQRGVGVVAAGARQKALRQGAQELVPCSEPRYAVMSECPVALVHPSMCKRIKPARIVQGSRHTCVSSYAVLTRKHNWLMQQLRRWLLQQQQQRPWSLQQQQLQLWLLQQQLLLSLVQSAFAVAFVAAVVDAAYPRSWAAVTVKPWAHPATNNQATPSRTVVSAAVLPSIAGVAACSVRRTSTSSRAAASGRHVWRGACPSRVGGAFCSAVAVHAASGGASSEDAPQPAEIDVSKVAVMSRSELEILKEKIVKLETKIEQLEFKIEQVEKQDLDHPDRLRLPMWEQQLAGLQQSLAELLKKQNILLDAEKLKGVAAAVQLPSIEEADESHMAILQALLESHVKKITACGEDFDMVVIGSGPPPCQQTISVQATAVAAEAALLRPPSIPLSSQLPLPPHSSLPPQQQVTTAAHETTEAASASGWSLPDTAKMSLDSKLPTDFHSYVLRPQYKKGKAIIKMQLALGTRMFLLLGDSGIGKSVFLTELLRELLQQGLVVIWQDHTEPGTAYRYSRDGVTKGPLQACAKDLQDPNTWYLCDSVAPYGYKHIKAITFCVASRKKEEVFGDYKKDGAYRIWFSDLTQAETVAAAQAVGVPEDVAIANFKNWGGIVRICVKFALNKYEQAEWQNYLEYVPADQLFAAMFNLPTADKASVRLFRQPVTEDLQPTKYLVWGSAHIQMTVMKNLLWKQLLAETGFTQWCTHVTIAKGMGGGVAFEWFVTGELQQQRDLRSTQLAAPVLCPLPPLMPVLYRTLEDLKYIHDWLQQQPTVFQAPNVRFKGLLCVPTKGTEPAVDFIALIPAANGSIAVKPIQSTDSESHPVAGVAWEQLIQTLQCADTIYFSVPENMFTTFPAQKWLGHNKPKQLLGDGPAHQFVLTAVAKAAIPVSSSASIPASTLPISSTAGILAITAGAPATAASAPGYYTRTQVLRALQQMAYQKGMDYAGKNFVHLTAMLRSAGMEEDVNKLLSQMEPTDTKPKRKTQSKRK